jgi:glycosyltransferase involved in cell wall biosynthesis
MAAVLVSHPHVASFSAGVARGLARAGQLAQFTTGVAFPGNGWRGRAGAALAARWPVLHNRALPELSSDRVRSLPLIELGARAAARGCASLGVALSAYDALFVAHDAVVACLPWPRQTTAVYAYEDAAWRTFARAQRLGLRRIWDLPLPHHRTIESLWRAETERWPEAVAGPPPREPDWKRRRKDAELALATDVVVASAFTGMSLEAIGVSTPRATIPYGFPTELFALRPAPPRGRFTVLSVGTHDLRKGTPYLLEAWRRAALPDAELHLIGPLRLAKPFVDRYAGMFRHWPHLAKSELAARYAAADLLAFPTLGDGFGLVIQEAMCCGTPVVTTPCGGGPECITDGVDGWLVPPRDVDTLASRLREAAANRDRLAAMGAAARARAERWTWRDAGEALVRALGA